MDDFEKAVLVSFNQTGTFDANTKEWARAYCEEATRSPDCWRLCLHRFSTSGYAEVRFWCLQALHQVLLDRYKMLSSEDTLTVKGTLMAWVHATAQGNGTQLPAFLRNKLAQVIVQLVKEQYPEQWPSFFSELTAAAGEGTGAVDMFCRILMALDDDIISMDVPRSQADAKAATELKDAMRERCLPELLRSCYQLILALHAPQPHLAAGVLQATARYVSWIDIGLVANEQFVPLLFALLGSGDEALAGAAAEVLQEVGCKRMEASAKLAMAQQLALSNRTAAWAAALRPGDESSPPELALKCARLLASLATEVLEAWKRVENSMISMAAVGLAVAGEATAEASAACAAAQSMLSTLFPPVLQLLHSSDADVAMAGVPLLHAYVGKLKAGLKRAGHRLPEAQKQHVLAIMDGLTACASFPSDLGQNEAIDTDTSEAVSERRSELFTLLKNCAKVAAEHVYAFVRGRLQAAFNSTNASWQEVEMVTTLVYELGEGAPEDALKPAGSLAQLATALMQAEVPAAEHSLVALALLECFVRYAKVLAQQQQHIPQVLAACLGPHGLGHPDEAVSTRACYLLCRLCKALRQEMRPHVAALQAQLTPHLHTIAASPRPDPTPGTKTAAGAPSATDDRLYAYEAIGLLLGQEELPAEQQLASLESLTAPLLTQMETHLGRLQRQPQGAASRGFSPVGTGPGRPEAEDSSLLVQQALEAITRMSKGLSLGLCTRTCPKIGALLQRPLQLALQCPLVAPSDRPLRARVISFLHRMVECLGAHLLPLLPSALQALLPPSANAADLGDVMALLHQLAVRYKADLGPLIAEVLPQVVAKVSALLPPDSYDWSGRTAGLSRAGLNEGATSEEARERGEVQRSFYSLLHALVHNALGSFLLAAGDSVVQPTLNAVIQGAALHCDAAARRSCIQILRQVVTELANAAAKPEGYQRFLLEAVAGQVCLQGLALSQLDPKDAAVNALLSDAASLLLQVGELCGVEQLSMYARSSVLPYLAVAAPLQDKITSGWGSRDVKTIKQDLRSLMRSDSSGSAQLSSRRSSLASVDSNGNMMSRMSE